MNISGILVHARPERMGDVESELNSLPGVEVHMRTDDGRLVVTVEETGSTPTGERFLEINHLDGVLSAMLVYHHLAEEEDHESNTA